MKKINVSDVLFAITFCTIILTKVTCADMTGNVTAVSENDKELVMYSYSEAVVGDNGNAVVSQLTIAKGKDGEYHYVKSEPNGTTTTGKWSEPLPSTPVVKNPLEEKFTNMTNEITERMAILNRSIGSRLQDFLKKASTL